MKRRRIAVVVFIASTLLVVLAIAYVQQGFLRSSSPPARLTEDTYDILPFVPPPKEGRSSTVRMQMPPEPAADEHGATAEAAQTQYCTNLLFIDDAGKEAPNVAFEVVILAAIVSERAHRRKEVRYGVSDSDGRAQVLAQTNEFDGTIKVGDVDWVQAAPVEFSGVTHAKAIPNDKRGAPPNDPLLILVQGLVAVEFRFRYDDGLPFTGTATLHSKQLEAFNAGTDVDETSSATFRVAAVADLECWVTPKRPGYDRIRHPIPSDQVFAGAVIDIVVPPSSRPTGNASVDTSALTRGQVRWWYQLVVRDTGKVVSSATQTSVQVGDVREFKNLLPGWYILVAGCGEKISRVDFEVTAARLSEVALDQVYDPAQVSVVILDESGNLLNGGVLRTAHRRYVDYPARDVPGAVAVSDSAGVARLGLLHPDTTQLVVEANGFEPKLLDVVLSSGHDTDFGPVRLEAALGRIEVRVENIEAGGIYRIGCIDPYGSGGKGNDVEITGSAAHVYERLPLRLYTVYVVPKGGGKVHSLNIELTAAAPSAEVVLDASKTSPKK